MSKKFAISPTVHHHPLWKTWQRPFVLKINWIKIVLKQEFYGERYEEVKS